MCGPIDWLDDKEKPADYSRLFFYYSESGNNKDY